MDDVQIDSDALNAPALNLINGSTDPTAPGSGHGKLYLKDGAAYVRLDTGSPVPVGGTPALAEGQLAVGDAGGSLSALDLGTPGDVVTADANGMAIWAAPTGGSPAFVGARVYHSADQNLTQNQENILSMDSEAFDTDAFHDTSTNNSRITVPSGKAGYYLIGCHYSSNSGWSGRHVVSLRLNGTTNLAQAEAAQAGNCRSYGPSTLAHLAEADYVEVTVYPTVTGTISSHYASWAPSLWLVKVG